MAYDEHWSGTAAGPIASMDWVERVLRYAASRIPSSRIVLGLGLYGYDWAGGNGRSVTWDEVHTLATMHGITSQVALISQPPHFSYTSEGTRHEVWYEDVRSITAKLDLARRYGVGVICGGSEVRTPPCGLPSAPAPNQ